MKADNIVVNVIIKAKVELSLWAAFKLRLAGRNVALIEELEGGKEEE